MGIFLALSEDVFLLQLLVENTGTSECMEKMPNSPFWLRCSCEKTSTHLGALCSSDPDTHWVSPPNPTFSKMWVWLGVHTQTRATPLVCLGLLCSDLVLHSQLSRLSLLSASVSLTHWALNWIVQEGKGKGWEVSGARQKTDYLQTGNWKVKMQRSRSLGVRWCPAFGTLGQEASGWPGLWLLCKPGKHSQCHILPGTTWEVLHIVYF